MKQAFFETFDYAIGGKLVVGKATMADTYMQLTTSDEEARQRVRTELIHQMAEFMLQNQLVEFTQYKNPMDLSTTVAVRAYLAPNDQVKILRLANKIV